MDNQIAQFIDNYAVADQFTTTDMEAMDDVDMHADDVDQLTSWETFCAEADAWARHAEASNGFGGI